MAKPIYAEYKKQIRALAAEYGRQGILVAPIPLHFLPAEGIPADKGGVIRAKDPSLKFKDGAILLVQEEIRVVNNQIELLRYSYHYERPNGYFFRYEREDTTDTLRKPEYHMHVVLDLPHFVAPPVNLEIIIKMIAVNFYSQDIYSRQIVGHAISLTV
ncbi:MAG: toxin-antitoxin system TumE family protein [bacterium]